MDQHLSLVTLVVTDLAASRRFYVEGLGWTPEVEAPGEVVMIRVGPTPCCRCGTRLTLSRRSVR